MRASTLAQSALAQSAIAEDPLMAGEEWDADLLNTTASPQMIKNRCAHEIKRLF